jgi:hypothetical protein
VEKRKIVALLEALCDRPLGADEANDPARLQALCRGAADALARKQPDFPHTETVAETDRLTALVATVLSCRASDADRALLAETLAGSPTYRLEVSSAQGFLDTIEATAQPAPAELIDQLLRGDAANKPSFSTTRPSLLSAIANGKSAPNWRAAAAVITLLFVVGGAWSLYSQREIANQPSATANSTAPAASVTTDAAPAPAAPPALATAPPCEPHAPPAAIGTEAGGLAQHQASEDSRDDANCLSPADSRTVRNPDDQEVAAARARAEAARAQAEAAAKFGAAQADREGAEGTLQADKAIRPLLDPQEQRPAAARAAPSYPAAR